MGLLNIGASGLLASQTAINTTGHNIANANVEGYSVNRRSHKRVQQFMIKVVSLVRVLMLRPFGVLLINLLIGKY